MDEDFTMRDVSLKIRNYKCFGEELQGLETTLSLNKEPAPLRRGKLFHKQIQTDWINTAEGQVQTEKTINKPTGRKGRIDIYIDDAGDKLVAVAEVKASDWDRMTDSAVRRNLKRQIKQIWDYIGSQLEEGKEVSPGVIFSRRPEDQARITLIEKMFEEEGIPVVWQDETIEERKNRA